MAALLILPLLLHTATAGTGLEQVHPEIPKLCQQGPEYWCQSDETASLCMKEDFCMELWLDAAAETLIGSVAEEYAGGLKEWRRKDGTHPLRSQWGWLCTACKYVFNFLKSHVANSQSSSEISRALDRVCDSVWWLIRWACRLAVKIFRRSIVQAFERHRDAASICVSLRLCSGAAGTGLDQVHVEIPKLCQQGPEYWCQSDETASLCMKEDFCMELWVNAAAETLIGSGAEEYAGGLKEWRWNNGTNLEEISRALDNMCDTVLFLIRTPCKMGIRRFKTAIMKAFEGHQDSATFCANEHLCSRAAGTGVELVDLEIPKLCQQGPEYWCQSDETASLCMKEDFCMELWQNAPPETLIGSGAGESAGSLEAPFGENKEWRRNDGRNQLRGSWGLCRACKYVFKFLGKHLRDYKSNEDISRALDKVCKKVSILFRIPCKLVIRRYRKAIIQAVDMHEDSAAFCANVHLCSRAEETDVDLSYQEDPKLCLQGSEYWCQSEETASLCKKEDYCMELWQNVPAELEASSHGAPEDATEEEEEKRKKKKCEKRKKDKKNKKDKKGKKGKKNKKRKDKTDVKCSGCTQIMTNLQKTVGESLDDDTVNGAVDSMCDEVDASISEICTTMKENNKDGLVEAVKNGDSRKDICTQIQMCEGQELDDSEGAPVPAPSVGPTCIFCQEFISFVKPLLTDNVHKKDTGPVLADLCMEHFGNSTMCNNFLSTYGPMVKHVLLKPWDEVTTCQEVGACEVGIPMPQFDVKRAASRRKDLEDTRSTQLVMVNA